MVSLGKEYETKREEYRDSVRKMEQITAKNDSINIGLAGLYTNINSQKYDQMKDLKTALRNYEQEEHDITGLIDTARTEIEKKRLQKKILELEKEKQVSNMLDEEVENTDDIILLHEPVVNVTETKKGQMIVIFGLLGLILGVIISFLAEFFRKVKDKI
jgi:chromosome segregation ATPase